MRKKTGYVQRRGTSWRIAYHDGDGIRHFETHPTEEDARRELARRLADVAGGIPVSSKPNVVTFRELACDVINDYKVNGYKSLDDMEARFRLHIDPAFGSKRAAGITTAQLNAYIVRRRAETPAPSTATINRELEAIRHTFKLAIKGGKLFRMPHIPHLKENNVRKGFFTRAEVDALCAALPEPYSSFVLFGFLTGWRKAEIAELRWTNVDFVAGEIRLDPGTTKSGEGRVFPMTDELSELLQSVKPMKLKASNFRGGLETMAEKQARFVPYVFSINKKPVRQFQKTWKRACKAAGLPVIEDMHGNVIRCVRIFHDLRRSAVKQFIFQGIPERVIMQMCGWQTRSVFDRYSVVGVADLEIAREKINAAKRAGNRAKGAGGGL